MVLYCIIELFFWGIDFDRIFEYERLLIIWNLLGLDLGIIFKGDNINGVYGGVKNGFVICFDIVYREIIFKIIY